MRPFDRASLAPAAHTPPADTASYETRELAWELAQPRIDSCRIRFLLETGAVVSEAMRLANLSEQQILKNPQLRPFQLQRHLATEVQA